jgi:hypothetical protein
MSTEQKHRLLRALTKGPRAVKDFTHKDTRAHADVQIHPTIIRRYVAEMEQDGLLVHHDDDRAEITEAGLDEINRPTSFACTRQHHAANQPTWQPTPWVCPRKGGDDHKRYKSLSF